MTLQRAVILGAAGGFGRLFGVLLRQEGISLLRADLAGTDDMPPEDATQPSARLVEELGRCDTLILCLPETAQMPAYLDLCERLPPGAIVIDTLSVKAGVAALARRGRHDLELLSLEPMFAPDVGLAGENVIAVPLRAGPRSAAFLALLAAAGARITEMDAEQHDRMAAATQAAAHAALLAYGITLTRLDCAPDGPSTPIQRAVLRLIARIASRDPAVYWHIQQDNPFSRPARAALGDALADLDRLVEGNDEVGFRKIFEICGNMFGKSLQTYSEQAKQIVTEDNLSRLSRDA